MRALVTSESSKHFISVFALAVASTLLLPGLGCSGDPNGSPPLAQGGTSNNWSGGGTTQGGSASTSGPQQGGASNGGATFAQGGRGNNGNTSSQGGGSLGSGGTHLGGASNGGSGVGGNGLGGGNTGGNKASGGNTGGTSMGGSKATGGSATGGKATGGAATGGTKATGGAATGGSATGGAATGGAATGGTKATGGAATGGSATGGNTSSGTCKFPASHTNNGSLTWYTLSQGTSLVNCSFPTNRSAETVSYVSNNGTYFAAMNTAEYNTAAACGACVEVTRDNGKKVTVTIADQCPVGSNPKCKSGHIDLAKPAFLQLGTESEGYLGTGNGGTVGIISWRYVPCTVTGNVHVLLKEPSNTGWNQFLVANHRTPVAKFEAQINGNWVTGTRQTYNYFDVGSSLKFPVPVRITDTNGAVITGTVQSGIADQDIGAQFPTCTQ